MSVSTSPESLNLWVSTLESQSETVTEFARKSDLDHRIHREIQERLTRQCLSLEAEIHRLKEQNPGIPVLAAPLAAHAENEKALDEKNTEIYEMRARIRELEEQLEREQIQARKLRLEKRSFEIQMLESQTRLENTRRELVSSQEELQVLRNLIEVRNASDQLQARNEETLERRERRLEKNAERLRRYAATLNEERKTLAEANRRLVQEAHSSRSLHPLRDYLSLTERELTQVEIELKKMPSGAENRAKLEECAEKLIRQREFLRETIQAAEAEFAERSREVSDWTRGSTGLPPLPALRASN